MDFLEVVFWNNLQYNPVKSDSQGTEKVGLT